MGLDNANPDSAGPTAGVYFYFSAPTEPPPKPPPEVLIPEPPSPIAVLIAEDRCDLAYPQLTALDTIQHEPTAQAHLEFQRAFCERMLKKPDRAYDRLRDLDLPALDDYRRFWIACSLEDMGQTHEAIAEYENFLTTSANPILHNPARLRLASLYRTAANLPRRSPCTRSNSRKTPIQRGSSTCSQPPAKSTTRRGRKSGV